MTLELTRKNAYVYLVKTADGLHVVTLKSEKPGCGKKVLLESLQLAQEIWNLSPTVQVYLDASGYKNLPYFRQVVECSNDVALRQFLYASCQKEDLEVLRQEGMSWKDLAYARLGTQHLVKYYATLGFVQLDHGDPYTVPMTCSLNKLLT